MPYQIEDYSQRSAASELTKAGVAGALAFTGTELGGRALWKGVKVIGTGAKAIAPTLGRAAWGGTKFVGRTMGRASRMYNGGAIKSVVGGGARGAYEAGSWLYKNPGLGTMLIGGGSMVLGAGIASADYDNRLTSEKSVSPGIVEAMGGTSNYGTRQIMNTINAQGSLVFGANNRRRG